jgi:hypothetical protein
LFNKLKTAPAAEFLPKEGWLARLISGTRSVPEPALKDMLAAYDAAKKKAEQITPRFASGKRRKWEMQNSFAVYVVARVIAPPSSVCGESIDASYSSKLAASD